jgi:propionyl-CoA carboxylase alpha chain
MFKKILIANRGEIACRVIKSARRMGIKTVAVYSEADAGALHVEMADEAVAIGPAPAAESYLVMDKILAAVKTTGAEAVHPGYGFLSENAGFAEALSAAGVEFIGPGVKAIGAMGDKIESKKLAHEAKVSTVPGYMGVIPNGEEAVKIAQDIGYPVMIKASAGGGGKGMRVAYNDEEVLDGFASAENEARSSFGDDRIFVEKFIEQPRHIEIQVLADQHGTCIYLGERECSVQRRHQKVIEEAPSPFLDPPTRKAMGEQAVALAQAVDYCSAGTVEFIVDKDKNFFFLEMNTRLQVEHPVTEYITGVDLVEQMLRVAAGEKLSIKQEDVRLNGWAIEARLYAEDPYREFMPSIGRLVRCQPPAESPNVRVDTGVVEGSEISRFYDPMIAKLVTYGRHREEALSYMRTALDQYYVRGIQHNLGFLKAVVQNPKFVAGDISTNFIAEEFPDGFQGAPIDARKRDVLVGVAVLTHLREFERAAGISGQLSHHKPVAGRNWVVFIDDVNTAVDVEAVADGYDISLDDHIVAVRSHWLPGASVFDGTINGHPATVQVDSLPEGAQLSHGGANVTAIVRTEREAKLAALMPEVIQPDTSKFLLCPMPGLIMSIAVAEGEAVKAGDSLAVVEAMKMENVLRSDVDAVVKKIHAAPGDSLPVDEIILEFE